MMEGENETQKDGCRTDCMGEFRQLNPKPAYVNMKGFNSENEPALCLPNIKELQS